MSHSHKKPVTRREFLAAGMLPFAANLIMPNWMKILGTSPSALAADSCPTPGAAMMPFICVDLAGGAGLQANFVPHDAGSQPLASYTKMGLGTAPTMEREFGNVPFATNITTGFLSGLRSTATAPTIANTAFVAVCTRSRDDSSENPFSPIAMLTAAGLVGTQLPNFGTNNSSTGGNHKSAVLASVAPLIVKSVNDIKNSVGYAASLGTRLNAKQKTSLAKLVSGLNENQTRKIASMTSGAQVKTLLDCAGIKNSTLVGGGGTGLDPVTDPNTGIAGVWGVAAGTNATTQNYIFGSIAYNVLNSQAGAGTIALGGYDYHGNARAGTNQQDANAGALVGRLLETARVMGRPLTIMVSTDGSVGNDSTDPNANWDGDRGTANVAYMIVFDPAGRRPTSGFQIGNYTKDQVSDDTTVVGSNPEVAAAAIFANWLKLNNRMDLFTTVAGRTISATDLDKVIKFG